MIFTERAENTLEEYGEYHEELLDVQKGLEEIKDYLQIKISEGGMSMQEVRPVKLAIESYYKRLGLEDQMVSLESFDDANEYVNVALEGILDTIKKIGKAVTKNIAGLAGKFKEKLASKLKRTDFERVQKGNVGVPIYMGCTIELKNNSFSSLVVKLDEKKKHKDLKKEMKDSKKQTFDTLSPKELDDVLKRVAKLSALVDDCTNSVIVIIAQCQKLSESGSFDKFARENHKELKVKEKELKAFLQQHFFNVWISELRFVESFQINVNGVLLAAMNYVSRSLAQYK